MNMTSIAVLMTCHNRREQTLQCLRRLLRQQVGTEAFRLQVFLTDSASTDGTAGAVRAEFPEVVVIAADDSIFWNRGMRLAWQRAAESGDFDAYLWLNDDTMLCDEALTLLLEDSRRAGPESLICGTVCDETLPGSPVSYGGMRRGEQKLLIPNGELQACDFTNGNVVLIPRRVYEVVGNLDPIYPHGIGDYDYSLRALKSGMRVLVSSQVVGHCSRGVRIMKQRSRSYSLAQRWRALHSPLGMPPFPYFVYQRRHFGWLAALLQVGALYFRVIFPDRP